MSTELMCSNMKSKEPILCGFNLIKFEEAEVVGIH